MDITSVIMAALVVVVLGLITLFQLARKSPFSFISLILWILLLGGLLKSCSS